MALISRDPFAREELHREIHDPTTPYGPAITCTWCGGLNANGKLFKYRTETDGGRKLEHRGMFCSKPCHDSYHQC